jgi:uncharacterized protein (TIGR02001 family)
MKKKMLLTAMLCFILLFSINLFSKDFSYQLDINSSYIWRGWDINPVKKPVIQPSITYVVGDTGFALNLWTSFSFEDSELNEIDFTASYDFKTSDNLSLSAGFIHYGWYFAENFKFKKNTTQELYLTAGFPKVFLTPSISVYYDINNGDGLYVVGGISYGLAVAEKLNVDLSASLCYNGGQWLDDDSGFSDLNFGISFPFSLEKVNVSASAHYTIVLLDSLGDTNYFWVGLSFSI